MDVMHLVVQSFDTPIGMSKNRNNLMSYRTLKKFTILQLYNFKFHLEIFIDCFLQLVVRDTLPCITNLGFSLNIKIQHFLNIRYLKSVHQRTRDTEFDVEVKV